MGNKTQKLSNVVDQIVEWQSVVVADGSTNTTGVSGRGYFVDTSAGAHTINLPTSPKIGDIVKVSVITAGNDLTIGRNGNNINGSASDLTSSADGDMFELVYVNASEGWKTVGQITSGIFISATGGTVTTSGDYKIHSFTGDGCFVVSSVGNSPLTPLGGPDVVDYLVVAGGGAGGSIAIGGGGGAGGYRESSGAASGCYSVSPLGSGVPGVTITETTYPVTVGAGGVGDGTTRLSNTSGSNSVFSTITSAGGGKGSTYSNPPSGPTGASSGGSGGGGNGSVAPLCGASGNTPPVSPPQGNSGGNGNPGPLFGGGGGGGATQAGFNGIPAAPSVGGAGATSSINGTPTTRAGGGAGGSDSPSPISGGTGGGGAGGAFPEGAGTAGTVNTGSGGGGAAGGGDGNAPGHNGGSGGSGIVIIRYKFQ